MKRIYYTLFAILAILTAGCAKPDRTEEVNKLKLRIQDKMFSDPTPDQAIALVDSAELAGVFSSTTANLIRTNVYGQMGHTRLSIFYGELIKPSPELRSEGINYYSAMLHLMSLLNNSGEWGKALHLADEMIADVDQGGMDEQIATRIKSRALTVKGDCEKGMGHMEEAERYYLEGLNIMMDGVVHPRSYWVLDALFLAVTETTEFYLEWEKPQKALPLIAAGDTTLARLVRCPDMPEGILNLRSNNITINQALNYASNGIFDKAEALAERKR